MLSSHSRPAPSLCPVRCHLRHAYHDNLMHVLSTCTGAVLQSILNQMAEDRLMQLADETSCTWTVSVSVPWCCHQKPCQLLRFGLPIVLARQGATDHPQHSCSASLPMLCTPRAGSGGAIAQGLAHSPAHIKCHYQGHQTLPGTAGTCCTASPHVHNENAL